MDYMPYPKPDYEESGCKVGWLFYSNEADAIAAAKVAEHNARIDAKQGYDYGFERPGHIVKTAINWRVCTP